MFYTRLKIDKIALNKLVMSFRNASIAISGEDVTNPIIYDKFMLYLS